MSDKNVCIIYQMLKFAVSVISLVEMLLRQRLEIRLLSNY